MAPHSTSSGSETEDASVEAIGMAKPPIAPPSATAPIVSFGKKDTHAVASCAVLYPLWQDEVMAAGDDYTSAFAASLNGIAPNNEDTMCDDLQTVVRHHEEARQAGAVNASPVATPPATSRGTQARTHHWSQRQGR